MGSVISCISTVRKQSKISLFQDFAVKQKFAINPRLHLHVRKLTESQHDDSFEANMIALSRVASTSASDASIMPLINSCLTKETCCRSTAIAALHAGQCQVMADL